MPQCSACQKTFVDLDAHYERQPMCNQWNTFVQKSYIAKLIDSKYETMASSQKEKAPTQENHSPIVCKCCKKTYSTVTNLNKHIKSSIVCQKWIELQSFMGDGPKSEESRRIIHEIQGFEKEHANIHATFEAEPASKLIHIIWNVLLTDKETKLTKEILEEQKISHIVAILPNRNVFPADITISNTIMEYDGHILKLDLDIYDSTIQIMETLRKERKNVLVYCNSGYQRSIPFLCYYLLKHHPEEISSVEMAIDTILPNVDKENYSKNRNEMIKSIETVFKYNDIL